MHSAALISIHMRYPMVPGAASSPSRAMRTPRTPTVCGLSKEPRQANPPPCHEWRRGLHSAAHACCICAPQGMDCVQGTPIESGTLVRFQHVNTKRWLHSHKFASPISNQQEVRRFDLSVKYLAPSRHSVFSCAHHTMRGPHHMVIAALAFPARWMSMSVHSFSGAL